jgi:hypothetical protein
MNSRCCPQGVPFAGRHSRNGRDALEAPTQTFHALPGRFEDGPICCRSNVIHVEVDEDGDVQVVAERKGSRMLPLCEDPWFTFRPGRPWSPVRLRGPAEGCLTTGRIELSLPESSGTGKGMPDGLTEWKTPEEPNKPHEWACREAKEAGFDLPRHPPADGCATIGTVTKVVRICAGTLAPKDTYGLASRYSAREGCV